MSKQSNISNPFKHLAQDIPASIVVFLVAMPLCLGIALASGAPLFSGLIAGMIGGIVVGSISGSNLGVSGPAAGLAVIVLGAIQEYGFEVFLVAVVLAGIIQIAMGFLKGGIIAYYFPSSVIMGMLAGIGIIIFIKQIPHAFGYDGDPIGDLSFFQQDGQTTLSELVNMLDYISYGAIIVTVVSLAILLIWETKLFKRQRIFQLIPGPLVAVVTGILLNQWFNDSTIQIKGEHMVDVPVSASLSEFWSNFAFPDFAALARPEIYLTALIIAVVASLETLLCVEATDKLDTHKRITPTNRELIAQGVGNTVSGLIGGIPITQVIVRSSANVQSGGKTKASAVMHGFLILISIVSIPTVLNMIPLATLAAILLVVGYKLAKPALFKKMYSQGWAQFVPFMVTVIGVAFTDLLIGLMIGLVFSILFVLYASYKLPFKIGENDDAERKRMRIELAQEVTFINKARIMDTLRRIPRKTDVVIDASKTSFIHHDILEIIEDFKISAPDREIKLTLIGLNKHKSPKPAPIMRVDYGDFEEDGKETEVIEPKIG
jgi:MFS superfamily sulfate permease-like transporter